jgi:hypothetical protein
MIRNAQILRSTAVGLGLVALYCLVLATGLLAGVGGFLRFDSVLWPVIGAGVFFLLSRAPRGATIPVLLAVSVLFCGAVLSGLWASGLSDHSMLAGFFPHSDSLSYVDGSLQLRLHGELTSITSRRPIAPCAWAVLQTLMGGSVRGMLAAMVFLCACALVMPVRELVRSHGYVFGFVMFVGLQLFYRRFIGTALSEHVGLLLGCVAFASLWRGMHARQLLVFGTGLFVLALGLNARAGAFFVIPALILWSGWAWRDALRFSWRAAAIAAACAGLGFALNSTLLNAAGTPGAAMGNFSYTLYGLVHGGDWTQVIDHYPEVRQLPELERYEFIYDKAMVQIKAHPFSLVSGAFRSYGSFFFSFNGPFCFVRFALQQTLVLQGATEDASTLAQRVMANPWRYIELVAVFVSFGLLTILAWIGAARLFLKRPPAAGFLALSWLGILASVPFAPPWDADLMRVYAATMPIMLVLPVFGTGYVMAWIRRQRGDATNVPVEPAGASGLLALSWIVIPLFCLSALPFSFRGDHTRVDREVDPGAVWTARLLQGSRVAIQTSDKRMAWGQSVDAGRASRNLGVLAWSYPHRAEEVKQAVAIGGTLALAYEERTRTIRHVVLSSALADTLSSESLTVLATPVRAHEESMWWHLAPVPERLP